MNKEKEDALITSVNRTLTEFKIFIDLVEMIGQREGIKLDKMIEKTRSAYSTCLENAKKAANEPGRSSKEVIEQLLTKYPDYIHDDGYHGVVSSIPWREFDLLPEELKKYMEVENMGEYSMIVFKKEYRDA